ncbi:hypothetical protein [Chryseobacterium sp. OV279]|uniref:hypothetical protein n=1 Tax=Chryseobacterium sp. OV279 TaxID=1500285 RepID=UPI0009218244|nr:hypothetical protein [Chryseobacterium sp. OV279]SHE49229.1 hypothetical protein SAMN02787100_0185 [Chryseobacterium sp. OV279]
MTKKLTISVVLAFLVAISLHSCRSEDLLNTSEEQQPSKFRVFTAQEKETINYAKGFKTLLERYDEINNVQHTAKALKKALKNSSEMADEYVELNIRSQDFTTKTNEKFTLFPLIKNGKVDGIIIAILKENDTQVEFLKMYPEVENYDKMLGLFKEAFLKNTLQQRIAAKGNGNCSSDGSPCDTGEVVITMPGTGGGIPGGIWNGGPPPGGCQPYDNCLNPDGGGGSGGGEGNGPENGPTTPANPCEQTKGMLQDQKVQNIVNDLKGHMNSGAGGEKGWRLNKIGAPTQTTQNSKHSVNFGNPSTMNGGYHNHTGTKIDIFSATDISALIDIARYQNIGDAENGFMGLVAPNGIHYVIHFNGSHSELPVTGSLDNNIDEWNYFQIREQWDILDNDTSGTYCNVGENKLNSKGLEKIFFSTLKRMGLENKVVLQKINENNSVSTINLNSNGATDAVPCI